MSFFGNDDPYRHKNQQKSWSWSACQMSPSYDVAFRRSLETEKNKQTFIYSIRYSAYQFLSKSVKYWRSNANNILVCFMKNSVVTMIISVQVNYLLPVSSFIGHMSSSLLCHESLRVREKSHLLLNARLRRLNADKLSVIEVCLTLLSHILCVRYMHKVSQ